MVKTEEKQYNWSCFLRLPAAADFVRTIQNTHNIGQFLLKNPHKSTSNFLFFSGISYFILGIERAIARMTYVQYVNTLSTKEKAVVEV